MPETSSSPQPPEIAMLYETSHINQVPPPEKQELPPGAAEVMRLMRESAARSRELHALPPSGRPAEIAKADSIANHWMSQARKG